MSRMREKRFTWRARRSPATVSGSDGRWHVLDVRSYARWRSRTVLAVHASTTSRSSQTSITASTSSRPARAHCDCTATTRPDRGARATRAPKAPTSPIALRDGCSLVRPGTAVTVAREAAIGFEVRPAVAMHARRALASARGQPSSWLQLHRWCRLPGRIGSSSTIAGAADRRLPPSRPAQPAASAWRARGRSA